MMDHKPNNLVVGVNNVVNSTMESMMHLGWMDRLLSRSVDIHLDKRLDENLEVAVQNLLHMVELVTSVVLDMVTLDSSDDLSALNRLDI